MHSDAGEIAIGASIEKYVVEGVLGQGGMARVYRVRHRTLNTVHALKLLTTGSAAIRKRLLLEGQTQAKLRHTNIVSVTDVLDLPSGPGLILEFVNGFDLEVLLERKALTVAQIDQLAAGIFRGVAFAHDQGLVHRDLKPANILLAIQGNQLVPKVADFGLVKDAGGIGNTRTGVAMGTPRYMSPEQIRDAKNVDARTDIFALGAILYFMITGRCAYAPDVDDVFEVFSSIMAGDRVPVDQLRPDVPPRMVDAIEGALAIDRDERFATVGELSTVFFGRQQDDSEWDIDDLTGGIGASSDLVPHRPESTTLGSQLEPPPESGSETTFYPTPPPVERAAPPPAPTPAPSLPPAEPTKSRVPAPVWIAGVGAVAGLAGLAAAALLIVLFELGAPEAPPVPAPSSRPEVTARHEVEGTASGTPGPAAPQPQPPSDPTPEPAPAPVPTAAPVPAAAPATAPVSAAVPTPRPVEAPAPEPAVAVTPAPQPVVAEPVAAPAPAPEPVTTATFAVSGARATLRNASGEFGPGAVPPGTYDITAFFDGLASKRGSVTLAAGDTLRLDCDGFLKICKTSRETAP
ncbi:MAG: protein kinase [Myxococcota bacterium]